MALVTLRGDSGDRVRRVGHRVIDPLEILEIGELDDDLPRLAPIVTPTRCADARRAAPPARAGRVAAAAWPASSRRHRATRTGRRVDSSTVGLAAFADRLLEQRTDQPSAAAWRPAAPGTPGRACRAAPWRGRRDSRPSASRCWIAGGSDISRSVLVTAERLLPTRLATCSWVSPKSSISCWYAAASSSGVRSWRCRFSTSARSTEPESSVLRTIAGIDGQPGAPRSAPAALAGDQLVAAVARPGGPAPAAARRSRGSTRRARRAISSSKWTRG